MNQHRQPKIKPSVLLMFFLGGLILFSVLLYRGDSNNSATTATDKSNGGMAALQQQGRVEEQASLDEKLTAASEGKTAELNYSQLNTVITEQSSLIEQANVNTATGEISLETVDGGTLNSSFPIQGSQIAEKLENSGISNVWYDNEPAPVKQETSLFRSLLPLILMILIFVAIAVWIRRRAAAAGGMMGHPMLGEPARAETKSPTTRFKDIAGCDEVIDSVKECVQFMNDPRPFLATQAKMPKGIILHGPPGTGKTMIARAIAGESGVPFFSVAGSEFVEMFVGVGSKRVRELFQQARSSEVGAVIFIDEIDAIGGKRSGRSGGQAPNEEREATLNQLLNEMDGFTAQERILVIAATNRIDTLDDALLRPGRLSRSVSVPLPARKGRLEILENYSKTRPLANEVKLGELADITGGCSGADLEEIMNEAAILAARERRAIITQADLEEAHLQTLAGPIRKDSTVQPEELRQIAFHEAGHVLAAELCRDKDKAVKVTIQPRNHGAAGLALYGQRDRALHSPQYVHQQLVSILGGRAAEQIEFNEISSGAQNDIAQANRLARETIESWGFDGHTSVDRQILTSEYSMSEADIKIKKMISHAYAEAVAMLRANHDKLQQLAEVLVEKEVLDRNQIVAAIGEIETWKTTPAIGNPEEEIELDEQLNPHPIDVHPEKTISEETPKSEKNPVRNWLERNLKTSKQTKKQIYPG